MGGREVGDPYEDARRAMVALIERYGVRDRRVLDAMLEVPRHLFVPEEQRRRAYEDHPLPIECGQTISQPYIVALMSELMELRGGERVLEVGTGSGYQAAVLSLLAAEVYGVEYRRELFERVKTRLAEAGYGDVHLRCGDGYWGWPEAAPFDAVMITCGAPRVPEPLIEQLKTGGRIVLPLGRPPHSLSLVRFRKTSRGLVKDSRGAVSFVPMRGRVERPPEEK